MKGVRRSEQTPYLELYRENQAESGSESTAAGVGSVPGSPVHGAQPEQSRIAKLEKLIKKRL